MRARQDVAEDLKEFVTGATPNSPAPQRATPAHLKGATSRAYLRLHLCVCLLATPVDVHKTGTASSPALVKAVVRGDRDSLSNPTLPPTSNNSSTNNATTPTSPGTGSSDRVNVIGGSGNSIPNISSPSPPPNNQSASPLDAYDDGSPAPPPSQDIATAMWEQAEKFPKLEVPWVLDYLAMQVLLRQAAGGGGSAFDAMLGEKKLAPYDITYAPGNVSWIIEKDPLIPLSLLKVIEFCWSRRGFVWCCVAFIGFSGNLWRGGALWYFVAFFVAICGGV